MGKSWKEKMKDKPTMPKVLKLEKSFPCYNALHAMGVEAGESVILVNPSEVLPIMQGIPEGRLITLREICEIIARKHEVQGCCTLTTGIFTMTIANAVEEMISEGIQSTGTSIPYWRTLKAKGELNAKYPGGLENQARQLEKEGFSILKKGKKWFVQSYEQFLAIE